MSPEGRRTRGAWRTRERVPTVLAILDIHQTDGFDDCPHLCFQQSAGNSTCPEVDLFLGCLRDRLLHDNVGDLEPAARLEDPSDLTEDRGLIGT